MRTYCQNVNIENGNFIYNSIFECLDDKWKRTEVASILAKFSDYSKREIQSIIAVGNKRALYPILEDITKYLQNHISSETISIPDIKYHERYDVNSRKTRIIGKQHIIHQFYEYIAVNAMKEMFYKKFGVYQCASIPKRGQAYGRKAIAKWMKYDIKGTRYAAKMDIKKCYPSIDVDILKCMLKRDIHKNPKLLYLVFTLIDSFDTGLSIGSHLSQWLCNYYLSYAYHYITEQLAITRNSKRSKKSERVRLISHCIFYMDDILIFSSNKKYLKKAINMIIDYFTNVLHLEIKDNSIMFKVQYLGKEGKLHGSFVDMMGFRFYRGKTTIRTVIFSKLKRKFLKVRKIIRTKNCVSKKLAQSAMSFWGWVVATNSYKLINKLNLKFLIPRIKNQISYYSKLERMIKNGNQRSSSPC